MAGKALFEKVWDACVVYSRPDFSDIYRFFVHGLMTLLSVEGLRRNGLSLLRPGLTATGFSVPAINQYLPVKIGFSRFQEQMPEAENSIMGKAINSESIGINLFKKTCLFKGYKKINTESVSGGLTHRIKRAF